jgi:hypothetical protein
MERVFPTHLPPGRIDSTVQSEPEGSAIEPVS